MPWAIRGLSKGVLTTRYPRRSDPYAENGVRALARVRPMGSWEPDVEGLCPTDAIIGPPGPMLVDQGRCIGCGHCVAAHPDLFTWRTTSETAELSRAMLVVPEQSDQTETLTEIRAALAQKVRPLRRSVHIRHVDAGSDGTEEWEILALTNPVYDIHRLGMSFTASPRHADILLVTGAGTHGMAAALTRTLQAMPEPTVVVAAGTDAISGGLMSPNYATRGGIHHQVPVDVWVPGSPPTPFALLYGLMLATDRLVDMRRGE